jgi:hypothetical protein
MFSLDEERASPLLVHPVCDLRKYALRQLQIATYISVSRQQLANFGHAVQHT